MIRHLVDRRSWWVINGLLSECGGVDVLRVLWGRHRILWLLTGEALLGCEARCEELGSRCWLLLLDTDGTISGVRDGVVCAVVGLCLASSVLTTLGVGRRRRNGGTLHIYRRGWDMRGGLPL